MYAFFLIKCQNHFAVTACLKIIFAGILRTYVAVIINFAVYGKYFFSVA